MHIKHFDTQNLAIVTTSILSVKYVWTMRQVYVYTQFSDIRSHGTWPLDWNIIDFLVIQGEEHIIYALYEDNILKLVHIIVKLLCVSQWKLAFQS